MSRDRKILEAAAKLFHERGFAGVSVDEIGEHAGVTGPAIYRHFKGKEEILVSIFDEALDGLLEATTPSGEAGRERLQSIVRAHAGYVRGAREHANIWARESSALGPAARRRFLRRTVTYFDRWIKAAGETYPERSEDEIEASVVCAIALLNSLSQWPQHLQQAEGADELAITMALAALDAGALPKTAARR